MSKRYEYLNNGVVYGPATGKDVRRLAAAGRIGPDDLIRIVDASGSGDWVPASKIRGLQFAEPRPSPADPPTPRLPAGADALASPALSCSSDQLPPPNPFAEIEVDPSPLGHPHRGEGVAAQEYALAVLYSLLGFLWACPVGFAGAHLISEERADLLLMRNLGLGCLIILFSSILLRSFRVRLWLGVLLLILPCLGIALIGVASK